MEVCLDKNIGNFTLKESNSARKIIAKKDVKQVPILKEKFLSQCPNENVGNYVWETTVGPQIGYALNC